MFAEDIALVTENLEEVNNRLKKWKLYLEGKGLKISKSMIEFIKLKFVIKKKRSTG